MSTTVVRYQIQTAATGPQSGIAPTRNPISVPYELMADGRLGVAPGSYPLANGLRFAISGFEVYPAVADLPSGRAIRSSVSGTLTATTAAARQETAGLTADGQPLRFKVEFSVAGLTTGSGIRTSAGTYRDLAGVVVKPLSMTALNASPAAKASLDAAGGFMQALGASRLYFAKGVGLVQATSSGVTLRLSRCRG
ncbi:MAG: hypothetical protein FWE35_18295 [Streptosporangiales bacterium]|nr:hypothetical protein [Streptosporangiales bacterium]